MTNKQNITKTFVYKLRTNLKFIAACEKALDDARLVYNCALQDRIEHYKRTGNKRTIYEQSRDLTEARNENLWIRETLRSIQQDALEKLELAYQAFFRRLKAKEGKAGFPRFKARDRYHTFSQKIETQRSCPLDGDKLTVPGVGSVRVRLSRAITGKVKQLRITRRASGWYALLVCEIPRPDALPKTNNSIGVDVGLTHFATLSNGEKIDNPHCLKRTQHKLKRAQRKLSRKKKGSNNRKKACKVVALKHEKVSNSRKDFHHKVSSDLVKRFDVIKVEDLNVCRMVKNHALAQSINDVAWSSFFTITKAKAENAGRRFEKVSPAYTSQECSKCGHRQKMPLSIRIYECCSCDIEICRDQNAAINILGRVASSKPVESDNTLRNRNLR